MSKSQAAREDVLDVEEEFLDAIMDGNLELVKDILKRESLDINMPLNESKPLNVAISNGHLKLTYELLKMGANVNSVDDHGATALLRAAEEGPMTLIQDLLKAGANPQLGNWENVLYGFAHKDPSILRWVIEAVGVDPNRAEEINGWTPLYRAVLHHDPEWVSVLLDCGADPFLLVCSKGRDSKESALEFALSQRDRFERDIKTNDVEDPEEKASAPKKLEDYIKIIDLFMKSPLAGCCGIKFTKAVKFCPTCGEKKRVQKDPNLCCGVKMDPKAKFCTACGKARVKKAA